MPKHPTKTVRFVKKDPKRKVIGKGRLVKKSTKRRRPHPSRVA